MQPAPDRRAELAAKLHRLIEDAVQRADRVIEIGVVDAGDILRLLRENCDE